MHMVRHDHVHVQRDSWNGSPKAADGTVNEVPDRIEAHRLAVAFAQHVASRRTAERHEVRTARRVVMARTSQFLPIGPWKRHRPGHGATGAPLMFTGSGMVRGIQGCARAWESGPRRGAAPTPVEIRSRRRSKNARRRVARTGRNVDDTGVAIPGFPRSRHPQSCPGRARAWESGPRRGAAPVEVRSRRRAAHARRRVARTGRQRR